MMPDEMNHPMGSENHDMHGHGPKPKTSILPWAILLVVILAVLIAAVMFRDRIMPKNSTSNSNNAAAQTASGYDAIFLTNGQVYFGKLSDVNDQYMTLKDIYYLQLLPNNLQGQQTTTTNTDANQQGQLTLRKLGKSGELHGPVDLMKINRDQILYYQEITEEGAVMKAIRSYQANPNAANANANSNTAPQAPATGTPANNVSK